MNKLYRIAALAAISAASFTASADQYPAPGYPADAASHSTITRAEVLADLQIWRESGLAHFERTEEGASPSQPGYEAAAARFEFLKSSQRYADLVEHFRHSSAQPPALAMDLSRVLPLRSNLTRAEVLADLQAWRHAGLEAFESADAGNYRSQVAYEAAKAKYAQLKQLRRHVRNAVSGSQG